MAAASTREAVRSRAIEKGLVAADAQLSEAEIFALIFPPVFRRPNRSPMSPAAAWAWMWSGAAWTSLRGTIEVASKPGHGTTVTLRLPLTLAIIDGLLVSVGDACFVLPLANTLECIELTREDIEHANGKHVANVRGRDHSLHPAARILRHSDASRRRANRSWWSKPRRADMDLWWTRCWEIARP